MKYVLDSSAALPWVIPEKDSAKAIQLRDDARNAIHELLAPDIFPAEVFNALLKCERTKRINVGDAKTLYASIGADIPVLHSYLPLMARAGEIASRYRVALYDCLYIALAERESCEVITADRGITSLQSQFSFILPLIILIQQNEPSHDCTSSFSTFLFLLILLLIIFLILIFILLFLFFLPIPARRMPCLRHCVAMR